MAAVDDGAPTLRHLQDRAVRHPGEVLGPVGCDGAVEGTAFKGGWGPNPDGSYLTRQLGLVTTDRGQFAVAIAVDGVDFETGTSTLTAMGAALAQNATAVPAGSC